ncbi:PDZ domain-containing protein [bacterium]|nr:PDZ domain-containing protein [bacterium]
MGAVIGSLFCTAPKSDLVKRYQCLMEKYREETKRETVGAGVKTGIALLILSGGTLGWETIVGGSYVGSCLIKKFDNNRFCRVLNQLFNNLNIEGLSIEFATSYQINNDQGINLFMANKGNIAQAVSRSAKNPFIFNNCSLDYIDPGSDRMSAVPIEDAYKIFHPTKIIAINVTGKPAVYNKKNDCEIVEIMVDTGVFDEKTLETTFLGYGGDFYRTYYAGNNATQAQGICALEGIGASLTEKDGYIKVVEIIPGSACWKQGKLQAEDLILKVAQGMGEPVDIVGMPVRDAVKLIRGEKGSEVRLIVKKPDDQTVIIPIIRDIVIIPKSIHF